jgi:hypothetical protein
MVSMVWKTWMASTALVEVWVSTEAFRFETLRKNSCAMFFYDQGGFPQFSLETTFPFLPQFGLLRNTRVYHPRS